MKNKYKISRKEIKKLVYLVRKNWFLTAILLLTGIGVSLLEGISISVILPVLEANDMAASSQLAPPFNTILSMFSGIGLSDRIKIVAVLLCVLTAIKASMLFLNNVVLCRLVNKTTKHFRMLAFDQILRVGMPFLDKEKKSHIQTITVYHTMVVGEIIKTVGSYVPKLFTVGVCIVMLFLLSWKMLVVSSVIIWMGSFLFKSFQKISYDLSVKYTDKLKDVNSLVWDTLQGMEIIRLFSRQRSMNDKFENEVDGLNHYTYLLSKVRGGLRPIVELYGAFSVSAVLLVGAFFVIKGDGQSGLAVILLFMIVFYRLLTPATAFHQARVTLSTNFPVYQELLRFLDDKDKPYIGGGQKVVSEIKDGVVFEGVFFKYGDNQNEVLKDVSFSISKGSKIGIVGSSGCGKTTLIKLLIRFYDPVKGRILVDGTDIRDLDVLSWRSKIGMVSQDIFLFHDTVRNNILFANPEASEKDLLEAAEKAYAHDFIKDLVNGYDTLVGERGVLLSGGQKQRIAIARAIISDPEILVFDEATSALDTVSERSVQEALEEVSCGKTVVTIAHRLSTLADSDVIIVLESGQIIEKGKHDELLESKGIYNKLVELQAM